MILNLRELAAKGEPIEWIGLVDMADAVSSLGDIRLEQPVEAQLAARYDNDTAIVTGTLTADLELVCSKCLKTFEERVEYPVSEMFTQDRSVAEGDEEIHLVSDERVELASHLIDTLLVHLPMAPVCDAACKGLCPVCGKDRNSESCNCEQDTTDPRLAGLKDFFKK